jgi:4-hydroxy-2-oxoheptanedioate aldolase
MGIFCNLPSPAFVEVLGHLGFDFVIIDAEHGPQDVETTEHMVRAADVTSLAAVVRVAVNLPQNLLRYLDTGVLGVQVPMVNTAAEAQAVVGAAKYPPLGRRGLASVRASGYGVGMPTREYIQMANEETLVVVQAETLQSMEHLGEIARVDQVDVVFVGPTDLSASMGFGGQPTHPQVLAAIERMGVEIRRAGKVAGTIARDPEAYRHWRERGFQYLATTATGLIAQVGRQYLEGCREQERLVRGAPPV